MVNGEGRGSIAEVLCSYLILHTNLEDKMVFLKPFKKLCADDLTIDMKMINQGNSV